MAAKKKITVEIDIEVLKKLLQAAEAISELAASNMAGSDDPAVRALAKKRSAKKRAK
jgi:hypothetical protein